MLFRSIGLPDGREGVHADGDAYIKTPFFAIDAGASGTSSVLSFDGVGWHEILRSREAGARVRFVRVQPCQETRNRLWIQMGGDLVYQEMPLKKSSPTLDSGARYMWEAVVESGAIDMGTASSMQKLIKNLTATIKNLNANGRDVFLEDRKSVV